RGVTLNKNYARQEGTETAPVLDEDLRGYTVGVDRGGVATNDGIISAERGNITLTGKHVLQDGALIATTGATANGSILLPAVDGRPATTQRSRPFVSLASGNVIFGEDSLMAILPDNSDEPVIGTDSFRSSKIEVIGNQIAFERGSMLYAPGARVELRAE